MQDPLLQQKENLSNEISLKETLFDKGLYLIGLTNEQIDIYGAFIEDLYQKIRDTDSERKVTRNGLTMIYGAMFALGSKEYNIEWKEHCSSSLREILHGWEGCPGPDLIKDFKDFYKNTPNTTEVNDVFKNLKLCYGYFSGIGHHDASGIMGPIKRLKGEPFAKIEDCVTDETFLWAVKYFFERISDLISISKTNP